MEKYCHKSQTIHVNQFGDIVCNNGRRPIEHPAVIIDTEDDVILKYGDAETLKPVMMRKARSIPGVVMVELDKTGLTNEQIAYIICRMVEFTSTGFVKAFAEHILREDFTEWLAREMEELQIDVRITVGDFA